MSKYEIIENMKIEDLEQFSILSFIKDMKEEDVINTYIYIIDLLFHYNCLLKNTPFDTPEYNYIFRKLQLFKKVYIELEFSLLYR